MRNSDTHLQSTRGTIPKELTHASSLHMIYSKPVFTTTVRIPKHGTHPTLGLKLKNDEKGPRITQCIRGTPASKVPRWRQILKDATIHAINDILITNNTDIVQIIRNSSLPDITLHVISPHPIHIHPDTCVPRLNFDQFLHICNIHQQILTDTSPAAHQEKDDHSQITINKLAKKTFTCTQLRK